MIQNEIVMAGTLLSQMVCGPSTIILFMGGPLTDLADDLTDLT
jgi:hypothetical protein